MIPYVEQHADQKQNTFMKIKDHPCSSKKQCIFSEHGPAIIKKIKNCTKFSQIRHTELAFKAEGICLCIQLT